MPGNAWEARAYGKCNREQTANPGASRAVRVKGCGKSAPRDWQQFVARQTPFGARPNRDPMVLLALDSGRLLEACSDAGPR